MIPNDWLCGFPIATFDDPGGFFCKGFPANVPRPVPGMFAAQDSKRKLQGVSPMRPSCRRSICHSWIYKLHGEDAESGIHRPVPQDSYNSGAVGTDSFICWVSNSGATAASLHGSLREHNENIRRFPLGQDPCVENT